MSGKNNPNRAINKHCSLKKMQSAFYTASLIAKVAFGLASIGLFILSGFVLLFSGVLNPGEGRDLFMNMLCAGIYTVGSVIVIGERLSIPVMFILGIILNILGAISWVPAIGSSEAHFAVIGIVLTSLWVICATLRILTANKAAHTNPLPRPESKFK
ncbi:hypothetical protein OAG53_01020 [Akkermansiaceae bacterium]|nr:hypothetical protein [Akkermansiaceae bacterium]